MIQNYSDNKLYEAQLKMCCVQGNYQESGYCKKCYKLVFEETFKND